MNSEAAFRDALLREGLLVGSSVDGLYGRSGTFEEIVDGLDRLISRTSPHADAEKLRFPPAMPRTVLESSGYLKTFPHFAGTIHCFCGDERAHRGLLAAVDAGEDWTHGQVAVDLSLTPAACYPVYPMVAARGPVGPGGHVVDVASYCFRHEPSLDPIRMQMFRMREFVRIGAPDDVRAFREAWLGRGRALAAQLELPGILDLANDPFFGRSGILMAQSQREQTLKFELLIPVSNPDKLTACMSFNYHTDHFSEVWDLRTEDGAHAHTACVGFGFERLALALLRHHGFDPAVWPAGVRNALWTP